MPRVFFVEDNPRYDISASQSYGEPVFLSQQINVFNTEYAASVILDNLDEMDFDPETDIICLSGQVLKVALFVAMVVGTYGKVKALMFDSPSHEYRLRVLPDPARHHSLTKEGHGPRHRKTFEGG